MRAIEGLSTLPEKGRPVPGGYREILVSHGRSRYVVRYVIEGDQVIVTKVRSGREQA